jgi:hypothetical protein
MKNNISDNFPITEKEYFELDEKFGQLTHYISWQLLKKNTRNNHTDDEEDIAQEIKISLIRAGSYFKRQVYIEKCLALCAKYAKGRLNKNLVKSLQNSWKNKTRHGAGKQRFGQPQIDMLEKLVAKFVPEDKRPSKLDPLDVGSKKFAIYCKSICWNTSKHIGKQISKMKLIRNGSVSINEFEYLT